MVELYRYYDDDDKLLYVGISICSIKRLRQHVRDAGWIADVRRVSIEKFSTREDALAAEIKAIQREKPMFNIVHKHIKPKKEKPNMENFNGLKKWRLEKGWSQAHLANCLSKRTGEKYYQSHIQAWETGTMPNAKIADVIRKLSKGKVTPESYGKANA